MFKWTELGFENWWLTLNGAKTVTSKTSILGCALQIAEDEASKEIISAKLWQLFGQIPELMEAQNVPLTLENPILWPVLCERILHKDAYCLHPQFQYGVGGEERAGNWIELLKERDSAIGDKLHQLLRQCVPQGPVNKFKVSEVGSLNKQKKTLTFIFCQDIWSSRYDRHVFFTLPVCAIF